MSVYEVMLACIKYKYQNLITFKYKKSVSVLGVYLIKDLFAFGLLDSCAFGTYRKKQCFSLFFSTTAL